MSLFEEWPRCVEFDFHGAIFWVWFYFEGCDFDFVEAGEIWVHVYLIDFFDELGFIFLVVVVMFGIFLNEFLYEFFWLSEAWVFPASFIVVMENELKSVLINIEKLKLLVPHLFIGFIFELIEAELFEFGKAHE